MKVKLNVGLGEPRLFGKRHRHKTKKQAKSQFGTFSIIWFNCLYMAYSLIR